MHPTFLPQRDLNTSSRQEIRNKYGMGSTKIIELIVEYKLKDLTEMKDNALLAQGQYAGNDVDSDKFGNEFYDMEIPELDGYSLRDVEDAINFLQSSQPTMTYDDMLKKHYPDRIAKDKDTFTKSSKFDRNESLNEMENAQIDRLELGANKTLAKAAVYRAENAVDAAKAQNAAGTTANTVAVDAAQKQLVDLNNQLSDVRTKHGQAKQQLQQELEIYEEIPTDEENIEEKTAAYEKLQKLKETIKTLFTQMGTLNKSVNAAKNAESEAVSATYQGKTDLAPLEKAVKDARNAVGKVGKGGGEIAETLLRQYEKERNNVNLMEQMDMYNETTRGSLQKFFEMFEAGKTTSEVIRHYAKNGIQIPEQFCSKVKKQFESYKKLKLELGFSEQEAKDFKKALDLSQKEDTKKLSTKIFKK